MKQTHWFHIYWAQHTCMLLLFRRAHINAAAATSFSPLTIAKPHAHNRGCTLTSLSVHTSSVCVSVASFLFPYCGTKRNGSMVMPQNNVAAEKGASIVTENELSRHSVRMLCICELHMRAPFWLSLFQTFCHSNEAILWFYAEKQTVRFLFSLTKIERR